MPNHNLISVCLCTCFRPDGLKNVLNALSKQDTFDGSYEIIVIDNDANGSARKTVDEFKVKFPEICLHYDIEPEKNISLARNKSVSMANGGWIAFIDDDEIPVSSWLKELIEAALNFNADGVFGPVHSILPKSCPKWILRGNFFEKNSCNVTGEDAPTSVFRTSNALIRTSTLKSQNRLFDPQYGLTGGEDFELFSVLLTNGSHFVWSNEAIVEECVPLSRTKISWIMKRNLRSAQTYADRLINKKGKKGYFELITRGLAGIGSALIISPLMLPFGLHRSIWWLRRGAQGVGYLISLTDYRYEPYRKS